MWNPFTSNLRMQLAEMKHLHAMEIQAKSAAFDRDKANWEEDKERLKTQLTKEHELKLNEVVTLTKLKAQQETKQQELDYLRKIEELKTDNMKQITEIRATLTNESYQKLSEALEKLHSEGNITTKFTQELALKMMEKAPPQTNRIELLKGEVKDI